MEITRQHVTGALALLDDIQLKKVWDIMKIVMANDELEEMAFDLAIGAEIENNPECHVSSPASEVYARLGITEEDLKDD